GVLTALPLLLLQHAPYHLHLLFDFSQPQYIMNLAFLALMCSAAAYLIWNEVMKILGSVTASNYLYLQPIVTLVAAYFVFGEHVYLLGYIGCALIIGGLVIADKLNLDKKLKK
ncbi:MAG: DMT family transporter, partial [Muribaculaceae bacterium]|nr:DMT family transporter [Muribaculaceae bacterium]